MVKNMTKIGGYNHQCDCMPRNVLQKNTFFGKIIQYMFKGEMAQFQYVLHNSDFNKKSVPFSFVGGSSW